jgi:hypothetical protein
MVHGQSRGILRHPVMLRINGDIKGDSESAEGPEVRCREGEAGLEILSRIMLN